MPRRRRLLLHSISHLAVSSGLFLLEPRSLCENEVSHTFFLSGPLHLDLYHLRRAQSFQAPSLEAQQSRRTTDRIESGHLSMDSYPYDENPPSYEQTYGSAQQAPTDYDHKPTIPASTQPTLPAQLDSVREQRIHNLINTYLQPLVTEQGLSGLCKATFVLIPSNVPRLNNPGDRRSTDAFGHGYDDGSQHSEDANTILGLPEEDHVKVVRLQGKTDKMEFWRQPVVLDQLAWELRGRLQARTELSLPTPPTAPSKTSSWNDVFRRITTSNKDILEPIPGLTESRWRAEGKSSSRRIGQGDIHVEVGLRSFCVRVPTSFGLWESRTAEGISVAIEVGTVVPQRMVGHRARW